MNPIILLDSAPLGMVTNPKTTAENESCRLWLKNLLSQDAEVIIPEITDYEVRRELLRARKFNGIKRLDSLKSTLKYLPIDTATMLKAAEFWSEARQMGRPTADNKALDGDMILAAQAALLKDADNQVIVATTNVKHLSLFVDAREWKSIK